MMKKMFAIGSLCTMSALTFSLHAAELNIKMYTADKAHTYVGDVHAQDIKYGLLLTPNLKGLPSGLHGFHVHVVPSCADDGMAAKGHLDPKNTGKHLGPYNDQGHLGDLPPLYVNAQGVADLEELAPRLTVATIKNHSLMIHLGGDNYSDKPAPLGGGGMRMICGVIN